MTFPCRFCSWKVVTPLFLVLLLSPLHLGAQETAPPVFDRFIAGSTSLEGLIGPMYSPVADTDERPVLNFIQANMRFGYRINDAAWTEAWYSGSLDLLGEVTLGVVHKGFADIIVGAGPTLRYSFVQPDWRFIPYVQAGIDVIYSDAYKDGDQDAMGSAISFLNHAGVGMRYLVDHRWSINLEGRIQHISNASLDDRNDGVNSYGVLLGTTYRFDLR